MKVLLVSEDIPALKLGGLGKHVVALGNALIEAGHDVALLGRGRPDYAECAEEVGFRGRFIPGLPDPTLSGWKEQKLGFFNPWKRPYLARQLARAVLAQASEFDVVHYHGHYPMIARYLPPGLNFVQTRHDQGSECVIHLRFKNDAVCKDLSARDCARCVHVNPGPVRTALSAWAVRRYRAEVQQAFERHPVVFVSDFLRRNYLRAMPQAELSKGQVIHNFVSESILSQAPAARRDPQGPEVLIHVAGRLDAAKGVGELLSLLAPRLPSTWAVQLFGDGPQRSEIEARFRGEQVHMHGHRSLEETLAAAKSADVVIVPSQWEEPCGTVILEALRLGKPCYALRRGGTPELGRYGGADQLRLFDSLPDLVTALLSQPTRAVAGGESADISHRLPAIIDLYRRKLEAV